MTINTLPLWFPGVQRVALGRASAARSNACATSRRRPAARQAWTQRPVVLHVLPAGQERWLHAEEPSYSAVEICVPTLDGNAVVQACRAFGCLAYSALQDPVARASFSRRPRARIDTKLELVSQQLEPAVQALADEVAAVCRRHGFAIATLDSVGELVMEPLSNDAVHPLRHARLRR